MKHFALLIAMMAVMGILSGEYCVIRFDDPSPALHEHFLRAGRDIAAFHPGRYLDLVIDESEYPSFSLQYPGIHITQTESEHRQNLMSTYRNIPGYHTYPQIINIMQQLTATHPDKLHMVNLGQSWGAIYAAAGNSNYSHFDHDIWAIRLSSNAAEEQDKPSFYFLGALHAREPISAEVTIAILQHLLDGYGTDPEITHIVETSQIWFVPVINPDGHKLVLDQINTNWRKNIRDNNNNGIMNVTGNNPADGVDLNRNFGHHWNYIGANDNVTSLVYHGPGAFSEPESSIFRDFLASHHFIAGISYHSYGELVLYPYGYMTAQYSPDAHQLDELAVAMAQTTPSQQAGQDHYLPGPAWGLYPASGNSEDWSYGMEGILAFTFELGTTFIPNAANVAIIKQNNLQAAKVLLNRKNRAMLTGKVTDSITRQPLPATIYVHGIDDYPVWRTPIKANQTFGSYYRFLPPGEWQVSYIFDGYETANAIVTISDTEVTVNNVALNDAGIGDVSLIIYDGLMQGIEGVKLSFPQNDIVDYYSDAMGIVSMPDFACGHYFIRLEKAGYESVEMFLELQPETYTFYLTNSALYFDGFEDGMNNWQSSSWNTTTNNPYTGSYCLSDSPNNYPNNQTRYCQFVPIIDLTGALSVNMQFYTRYDIALDGDFAAVQISTDGTTWQTLDYFNGTQTEWILKSYNLNHLIGQGIRIRFMMSATYTGNAAGIYIDEFRLYLNYFPVSAENAIHAVPKPQMTVYPNPFNPHASIRLSIPGNTIPKAGSAQPYRLDVFNLRGQLVTTLHDNYLTSGEHTFHWNSKDSSRQSVASGVYLMRLSTRGRTVASKKILLLK